jgi:hypothetical protein
VFFHWNKSIDTVENFSDNRQVGVIAQEVQAVMPEIVGNVTKDYLGVDYAFLTPLLIEGIKELSNQTDFLYSLLDVDGVDGTRLESVNSIRESKVALGECVNAVLELQDTVSDLQESKLELEDSSHSLHFDVTELQESNEELYLSSRELQESNKVLQEENKELQRMLQGILARLPQL